MSRRAVRRREAKGTDRLVPDGIRCFFFARRACSFKTSPASLCLLPDTVNLGARSLCTGRALLSNLHSN